MYCKFFIVFAFLLLNTALLEGALSDLTFKSESVILINADTGTVLFEKNSRQKLHPASIAKIATVAYALQERGCNLDKMITAEHECIASISEAEMERSNYTLPAYWLIPGATHIGIKRGEVLSFRDLLYGTMLASGGDSANMIANYIGGTIPTFMKLLNEYLAEIGCHNTVLKNPHGIHHPAQLTTAYDMAILTREAMKNSMFREIVKTVSYTRPQTNKQMPTTLIQGNRLLRRGKYYYPKAIGVKTGYYSKAQNNLVAAAKLGDRTLIAVFMKCKVRDDILSDAIKLFEEAFKEKKVEKLLLTQGMQKTALNLPNAAGSIRCYTKEKVALEYYPSEAPQMKCLLLWDKVQLPVQKDQQLGVLSFQDQNEKILASQPLLASDDVNYSTTYRIKNFLLRTVWGKLLLAIVGFFVICACFLKLRS